MTAFPLISVEIYPYEGTAFTIASEQILVATINQMPTGSKFSLTLVPGGPQGVIGFPSWSEVVTPLSTVVIALQRASYSNVVLVGVVEEIVESQQWANGTVVRSIQANGSDISYYFNHVLYTLFPFLQGNTLAYAGPAALGGQATYGLSLGRPAQIASRYLQDMFIGVSGVAANTYLEYSNTDIYLRNALYSQIEDLPITTLFSGDNFFADGASWITKLGAILPHPQYELLLGTAPSGQWSSGGAGAYSNIPTVGPFKSLGLPQATPAYPQFIARQLRLPDLTTVSPTDWTPSGADSTLWNSLPNYMLANEGFINSAIRFNMNDTKNFYLLNPAWMGAALGNLANVLPYAYQFYGYVDIDSIRRYSYKPWLWSTEWLAQLNPNVTTTHAPADLIATAIALTKRLVSYAEPGSLVGRGSVTMELRPDIFIGSQFTYVPFRDNVQWQFYVEQVIHNYRFGGPSTTTLTLDRGLPESIYTSSSMLFSILAGTAARENGAYTSGVYAGVAGFDSSLASQRGILAELGTAYVTPQFQ